MDCSGKNSTQTASLSMATSLVAFQVLGLALYQAGALHLKSINNILLQALINIALVSLLWYSVGYSLVFGSSQEGFIGNPDKAFFIDVSPFNCSTHAQNVPSVLFAAFEMTIAVCAPFMVIAPWTEHISIIGSMALFILWPITVYYPISHWIRGAGWLTRLDVLDYAGSLTVHTSAGTAGVVFTRMLKPHIPTHDANSKTSHHHGDAYHHVMFLGGALIIIFGWSLFNVCTVQMVQDASVGLAVVNTQLSACASCLCWVLVFTIGSRQCLYSDMLTGIIAGIIGVSAAPASLHAWASVLTGILVGVTSSLVLTCARRYFPSWTNGSQVDIIFSNGIPGSLGALAAGLFANPILDARHHRGAFYSNGKQLGVQLLAVVIVVLWTAVCTYLITWFIHLTVGFNITHSAAVDVALPGQSSSSKLHSQFLQREKLFSAAITGQVRDLEDLAAKHMNFGIKDFDKRTVLLLASSHGHIQCVKVILRQPGIDIHAKDRWGATALTEAIKYGHDRVVQCLIRHGASWAEDGAGGLLCTAVVKNDIEEISRLVSLGVDVNAPNSDGHCAIHVASKLGSRAVVQYLIDQRAEMNTIDSSGNAPLNYADMHEHRAVSQLLESLGARRVSRHYSIQEISEVASTGNLQMLRHMVHNGASICYRDVNHRTPLHVTSAEGHLDVVKFLVLQPGININAHDKNQFTPLLEAIINKHHDVVEFLKSHGAAVNECKLASLVTEKARDGDTKCLKRMLRWSGHVNICDFDGQTALHVAVMNGRTDAVSMLLREGADATLVNRFNKTPLELASSLHHTSLEKELRKHLKLSTQVSEASKQTDENTTSCYQRKSKSRRRKYKTEPSTYHYSSRDSWSSTDVSAEARKHLESSASTDNTSQQILSMRDVQNHQENDVLRPSFLRVMPVSQLSPQTRELTGGQPDYV